MKQPKLSMVLSMFNEEKAIKSVVEELIRVLNKNKISHQIILVEGGSRDNSFKAAKQLEKKFPQCTAIHYGEFLGEKIIRGLKEVKGKYVGIMYSDGQVDPYAIPIFLKILDKGKVDLVKGIRRSRKGFVKRTTSKFFNLISQIMLFIPSRDINGHPKIFASKLIPKFDLHDKDVTIDLEIMVKARRMNLKIKEILVDERDRAGGVSSVRAVVALRTFLHILFYFQDNIKIFFNIYSK
ncbi:MAG: glycosyltransferase family 2 protein [Patescibacteria group bacterium]